MSVHLAKYHSRSPRYILNTDDDYLIRVAGPHKLPWEEGTEIQNISLTGLAFTAPSDLCPILGEVIRIQFTPPESESMACHAIVTRLENISIHKKRVGIHFYKMDMAHRLALAQVLEKKFNQEMNRVLQKKKTQKQPHAGDYILVALLFATWSFGFWLLLKFGAFNPSMLKP